MKKIYINGRFLTQKITGVQRYEEEIPSGTSRNQLDFCHKTVQGRKCEYGSSDESV